MNIYKFIAFLSSCHIYQFYVSAFSALLMLKA